MKKILKSDVAAGILGLLIASLVYQPFAVYANNSGRVDDKEIAKVLKNKSLLQSELRRLGDYYEQREFGDRISHEQIKMEIIKNLEVVIEEQKKQIDSRSGLNNQEKEARKAIYDARLAIDKKEIMNDPDFNAKDYFYALADRLGARDINGIPFEFDDSTADTIFDTLLFVSGIGIILAIISYMQRTTISHENCRGYFVPSGIVIHPLLSNYEKEVFVGLGNRNFGLQVAKKESLKDLPIGSMVVYYGGPTVRYQNISPNSFKAIAQARLSFLKLLHQDPLDFEKIHEEIVTKEKKFIGSANHLDFLKALATAGMAKKAQYRLLKNLPACEVTN